MTHIPPPVGMDIRSANSDDVLAGLTPFAPPHHTQVLSLQYKWSGSTSPKILVIRSIPRPYTIKQVMESATTQPNLNFGWDLLISQDDLTDTGALTRDRRLSENTNPTVGIPVSQRLAVLTLNRPVLLPFSTLKLAIINPSFLSFTIGIYITIDLH